jgi:DUF4097 and DUF4098 domain-containing protein YvlB
MRSFILMAMFLASFASSAASDYTETRDLAIDAAGLELLFINAGAGKVDVEGVDGISRIEVKATIVISDADEDDARKIMEKRLELSLDSHDGQAVLKSWFEHGFWGSGSDRHIDLEIRAPATLAISIDDGSGSIDIRNFASYVRIDDGSGSIDVHTVGALDIDDGSGSIDVTNVTGDVFIDDGSGTITVDKVGGSVTVDDGSGSIRVTDVAEDLIILDGGSGSISFSNVRGTVEQEDG